MTNLERQLQIYIDTLELLCYWEQDTVNTETVLAHIKKISELNNVHKITTNP